MKQKIFRRNTAKICLFGEMKGVKQKIIVLDPVWLLHEVILRNGTNTIQQFELFVLRRNRAKNRFI